MWDIVSKGDVNMMISYLVMACGSVQNRTTEWSVNAIEKYTRISRGRARDAVERLKECHIIHVERGGRKPLYSIVCDNFVDEPEWIWLPNAIVTGAANETPAIELLRQSQNQDALRLFVNLYGAQNLLEEYGVPRAQLWQKFQKHKMGEHGAFIAIGFENDKLHASPGPLSAPYLTGKLERRSDGVEQDEGWQRFFAALEPISLTGLAHFVAHVVDGASDLAEVAHPLPIDDHSTAGERAITFAAERAVEAMLGSGRMAATNCYDAVLPVERHRNVELVGILRMKYLPKTTLNEAWIAKEEEWSGVADRMRALQDQAECGQKLSPAPLQPRAAYGGNRTVF